MKKILIACIVLTLYLPAFCQLTKRQWLVGGSLDFSYSDLSGNYNPRSHTSNKTTNLLGSSDVGYFIADKLCAGLRPTATITDSKQTSKIQSPFVNSILSLESKGAQLGGSPFVRYYFLPKAKKINLLADISWIYSYEKTKQTTVETSVDPNTGLSTSSSNMLETKDHTNAIAIEAGPAFFLNQKVSLELTVGYIYYQYSNLNSNSLVVGLSFHEHLTK